MCGKALAMRQQVWRMVFDIKNIYYFLPECKTSAAFGELKPTVQTKVWLIALFLPSCSRSGTLSCLSYPAEDRRPEKLSGRAVKEASTTNGCAKGRERRDHAHRRSRR